MRLRSPAYGLLAAGLLVVAVGGCGSAHGAGGGTDGGPPAAPMTVRVTGRVARSCVGPLLAGRPRRCADRAVFARGGRRVTVTGRFSIRLRPGRYHVSVDTCADQATLDVKRAIAGLHLVPRCALPL